MQSTSYSAHLAKESFLRWCAFAFFRWQGVVYRKEYIKGFLALYIASHLFYLAAIYAYLVWSGAPADLESLLAARRAGLVSRYVLLPFLAMQIVLDVKRLRSVESFPLAAFVFNLAPLIPLPQGNAFVVNIVVIATYVYWLSLALLPPKIFTLAKSRGPLSREVKIYDWRIREKEEKTASPE